MKDILRSPKFQSISGILSLLIAWAVIFAFFSWRRPDSFPHLDTVQALARQSTIVCFAALGMTCVIVAGGIDLSVGSLVSLTTVIIALILRKATNNDTHEFLWWGIPAAILGALGVGATTGFINGTLITRLKVSPFITTLGSLLIFRGLSQFLADDQRVSVDAKTNPLYGLLAKLDTDRWWKMFPVGVWTLVVAAVLVSLMLTRTRIGRHIVAVGSNEAAARLCGVNINRVKLFVYVLVGVFTGIAGIMMFSYLTKGDPTSAPGLELDVIAAVVIGGASLSGGQGTIIGTIIGALIMSTIRAGCTQLGFSNSIQQIVTGVIIVGAVALDRFRTRK